MSYAVELRSLRSLGARSSGTRANPIKARAICGPPVRFIKRKPQAFMWMIKRDIIIVLVAKPKAMLWAL